jgi:hypothetical protein
MKKESVFEQKIGLLLKWRKRRRLFSFLVWFFTFSLILNAVFLGFQKIYNFFGKTISITLVLTLISLGLALLRQLMTRKDFLSELIQIDSRLQLKERLSTAFEYRPSGKKSRFQEQLLNDAGEVLDRLTKKRLYPLGFSMAFVLIPLFAFILLGLQYVDFSSPPPQGEKTRDKLSQIGLAIERFSKAKIQEISEKNDRSPGEPYRQLEEIAEDLQNQSLKQEKLLLALGEMKKEALAERLHLTRKLEKELNGGGSPGAANPFSLPQEFPTSKDLEKAAEQLKDLFNGHLPESIAKDISRIGEKLELEQFLEKTINLTIAPGPAGEERSFLSKREKGYGEGGERREKMEKSPGGENRSPLALEKEQAGPAMTPRTGQGLEDGRKPEGREVDEGFTAGSSKGTGERLLPSEFKRGKGPSVKEGEGSSGQETGSSFQARALPLFGKTKNGREEILPEIPGSHGRGMEGVLLKEKIPQEYKEYIKHYFLSIRQERGKRQDDRNQ